MNYWTFKCDPKRYGIAERMADGNDSITWLVNQHRKRIAPGDLAFLMQTGPKRCLRAVMRIDTSPRMMEELESEQQYWKEKDTETRCRVQGTITHRFELPITELEGVDELENLSILKGPHQGTNFAVTPEEAEILMARPELVGT